MRYAFNIREVTFALSEALDLVGIDDTLHGKRVAYMAAELGKELGYDQQDIDDLIFMGMIHDCGVSSTSVHTHLVNELDWNNSQEHAIRGEKLLLTTNVYKDYATPIRYHHTHWDKLPEKLTEKEKIFSNIIYLVDRVDALRAQMADVDVRAINTIQETIKKYATTMFAPELVIAFLNISNKSSFWFYLESDSLEEYLYKWIHKGSEENFTFESIKQIALMFAYIVDAKSNFTCEHSIKVSQLSRLLASKLELPKERQEVIELAALLHDLGKLRVEDAILNKPNTLNANERLVMNRHSFDTGIILNRVDGFKEIAKLGAMHHEKLNGKGYPYNYKEEQIPFEARIITVADIFQALIQNRPYRQGLDATKALDIIEKMQAEKELDAKVVYALKENLDFCYEEAIS